ncbi:MAG: Uma2 family endonuclease [Janthinobacterium lividum]
MSAMPKQFYTPEEYLKRERMADYKSEYFSGEIIAMAGAKRKHNLIAGNIFALLNILLREAFCEVYTNDMKVQADRARQFSYPDVVVVRGEPQFRDNQDDVLLNPTVIVEVLSPSTEAFDRGEKFLRYRQNDSLTEYLLISQYERRIEQFTKQSDGSWRLTETSEAEDIRLEAIGCTLSLTDIYNKVVLEPTVRLILDGPR